MNPTLFIKMESLLIKFIYQLGVHTIHFNLITIQNKERRERKMVVLFYACGNAFSLFSINYTLCAFIIIVIVHHHSLLIILSFFFSSSVYWHRKTTVPKKVLILIITKVSFFSGVKISPQLFSY